MACPSSTLPPWLSFRAAPVRVSRAKSVETSFGRRFLFLAGPARPSERSQQELFKLADLFSEAFHGVVPLA